MPNLTANLIPTWLILAPLGPSWRQLRLQEASKWSSTGGPDRIWGHLGAKRAPKSSTPKNGDHFPAKFAKNLIFNSKNEPLGTLKRLKRLKRLHRLHRFRNIRCGTDPGFPAPGARITVVYTNSLNNHYHIKLRLSLLFGNVSRQYIDSIASWGRCRICMI